MVAEIQLVLFNCPAGNPTVAGRIVQADQPPLLTNKLPLIVNIDSQSGVSTNHMTASDSQSEYFG